LLEKCKHRAETMTHRTGHHFDDVIPRLTYSTTKHFTPINYQKLIARCIAQVTAITLKHSWKQGTELCRKDLPKNISKLNN
uniref:Uncharacterized protein n=1 Tax=Stegastes partitus TaxID=144197 RepID=A0A3B4ZNG7_9TELE